MSYIPLVDLGKKQVQPVFYQTEESRNLPLYQWWNWYSKALFILACFWNPKTDSLQKEYQSSMYCFLTSLFKLLPNEHVRRYT